MANKKILIAEDDKFLANAYRLKFTNAGYEVKLAANGLEALKQLEIFTPNIIIADLMMPIMDGYAMLKEVKLNTKTKDIPVIVTSNLSQPEDKDKCLKLGAQSFMIKSDSPITKIVEEADRLSKT
jgi:CheY-like chemotaxis protein